MKRIFYCIIAFTLFQVSNAMNPPLSAQQGNFETLSPGQLLVLGDSMINVGNYERALLAYSALTSADNSGTVTASSAEGVIDGYLGQANVYINFLMDYPSALKALDSAAGLREEYGIAKESIDFWYGVLYMTIGEQNSSKEYLQKAYGEFQKAYESSRVTGNEALSHYSVSNILLCSSSLDTAPGEINSLKDYLGMKVAPAFRDLYDFNIFLSEILQGEDINLESALEGLNSILERGTLPRSRYYPYVLYLIAEKSRKAGQTETALLSLDKAEASINPELGGDMLMAIYRLKYDIYRENGNKLQAADYYLKYAELKERMSSFSQIRNLRSVELQKDIDALKINLLQQKLRERKMRNSVIFISLFLLISCLALYILFRSNRRLNRANRLLFDKNASLLQAEEEYRQLKASQTSRESAETSEKEMTDDDRKKKLADTIDRILDETPEIWNPDFSAGRLAELAGCSSTTLSVAINSQFGMNFYHLIAERRIKEVCRRVNETDAYDNLSLEAIAESVGIKSRTTFTAAFKRVTGMTPSTYIKIARSKRENA